jgi:hypothetical protein
MNGLGKLSRETGHNLDPDPPERIIKIIFGIINSPPI